MEYEQEMARGKKFPFPKLTYCNIGNPHALAQPPLTFLRQIEAIVNYPELLNHPELFPADVVKRGKLYVDSIPGGVGAYAHAKGVELIRKEVAQFIKQRDGYDANIENIFLTDGASAGVQTMIRCIIENKKDGMMLPIPQYPLYSATIDMCGGTRIGYFIDEKQGWALNVSELSQKLKKARNEGIHVKALAVINPGNPTGITLPLENMKDIIRFCNDEKVILFADEVYQNNLWDKSRPWYSFKKVSLDMGKEAKDFEVVSFQSTSKGAMGECGRRGGYFELQNFDPQFIDQIYKYQSICLCSNVDGQVATGVLVNPPKPGEPSYDLWQKENNEILESLRRRSNKLEKNLNELEGIKCQHLHGALYAYPQIMLPKKWIEHAKEMKEQPDNLYCLEMLKETGLVAVPGSGFDQEDGTWHFRLTILPPEKELDDVLSRVKKFHKAFMQKWK